MSFKAPKPFIGFIPNENVLKKTIKILEKENTDLQSSLGRLTREKEHLEHNLNQKREMKSQAVEEAQEDQFKRIKVGDALNGSIDFLFIRRNNWWTPNINPARRRSASKTSLRSLTNSLRVVRRN